MRHVRHTSLWRTTLLWLLILVVASVKSGTLSAQIDTERVTSIGRNAIYFKDYVLAIQYFNTAIRYAPHRAEPYYYRAVAKLNLDDVLGAEKDCDLCLERNPFINDAYYLRAIARHTQEKDSLALRDYERVLQYNPDHQGALHNASLLYTSKGDTIQARRLLDHLHRYYPKYAEGYLLDGGLQLERRDTIQAVRLFEKALELSPRLTGAYLSLAGIAYDQRDFQSADRYMTEAIAEEPEQAPFFINRGLIRYQLNNIQGSMQDYSRAIELEPTNTLALYNRALLRNRVGELNLAQEDFNRLLQIDLENYFAIFNRALISNQLGDYRLAEEDCSTIISRYPSFAPAYTQRAMARQALGREGASKQDLYRASQLLYDEQTYQRATDLQREQERDLAQADNTEEEKELREDRDKNIRKFRLLVYSSQQSRSYDQLYAEQGGEGIRGRVQERQFEVQPEGLYQLSYYARTEEQLCDKVFVAFATDLGIPQGTQELIVVHRIPALSEAVAQQHMLRLSTAEESSPEMIWQEAMEYLTLKNHPKVVELLTRYLESKPNAPAALFQRAVSSYLTQEARLAEYRQEKAKETRASTSWVLQPASSAGAVSKEFIAYQAAAKDAITDLESLLQQKPHYAPALYNIAYIQAALGQYGEAITYYTQAIEAEPEMGAAYFNRGLAHYAIGEKALGDADLSRAGALGYYHAYSIIRRMK